MLVRISFFGRPTRQILYQQTGQPTLLPTVTCYTQIQSRAWLRLLSHHFGISLGANQKDSTALFIPSRPPLLINLVAPLLAKFSCHPNHSRCSHQKGRAENRTRANANPINGRQTNSAGEGSSQVPRNVVTRNDLATARLKDVEAVGVEAGETEKLGDALHEHDDDGQRHSGSKKSKPPPSRLPGPWMERRNKTAAASVVRPAGRHAMPRRGRARGRGGSVCWARSSRSSNNNRTTTHRPLPPLFAHSLFGISTFGISKVLFALLDCMLGQILAFFAPQT
ncbi:hypothetical protein BKA81DRAFT_381128 [Phyllosticta paracitricarpa]|uniref:Uncharacterized protein n=1 Tax=Phyllosticta citricarpa TaxID=55181 RepID=A0ABR1LPM2_9PEZI